MRDRGRGRIATHCDRAATAQATPGAHAGACLPGHAQDNAAPPLLNDSGHSHRVLLAAAALALGAPAAAQDPDAYASTYEPLPARETLIRGGTLLDGAGRRIDRGELLLRDGRIAAVGTDLPVPDGAIVIEAAGRWITPGIIDVHSHLGNATFPLVPEEVETWDVNEATGPDTAEVWAEHGLRMQDPGFGAALAGGVTTLHVLPGSANLFGGHGVVLKNVPAVTVRDAKFPGAPPTLKMACGENPKYTYGGKGRSPASRMGSVALTRQAFIEAAAYRRKREDDGAGTDDRSAGEGRDLRLETLAGVLRGDVRVHVHCYRAEDMAVLLDVADEFGFEITAFHHAVEAYKIAPRLARQQVCAAVWADWWGYKMEAYDAVRANAPFLAAAGGCPVMHSDSSLVGQRLTLEAAKAAGAGRAAGLELEAEQVIAWVTSNAARVLGIADRTGSLAAGKNADVVIWSGDPFSVYSKADQVFIDGALVYDRHDAERRPLSDFELGQSALEPAP